MASAQKASDQVRATVFVEGYCAHADLAYRYCYVLLLSAAPAKQAVAAAYREIAREVGSAPPTAEALNTILSKCWKNAQSQKPSRPKDGEGGAGHPLMDLLANLAVEDRSCLFLIDVAGRSVTEAASIVGLSEDKVRRSIASARRALMQHPFSNVQLPEPQAEDLASEH